MSDGLWEADGPAAGPVAGSRAAGRPLVDTRWVTMRVLVTVKAYPSITDRHGEAVCCAGVRLDTDGPEWVRLFPVPHRSMAPEQQFRKYDVVELRARRTTDDNRPESWQPNLDSLRVVGHLGSERAGPTGPVTSNRWSARRCAGRGRSARRARRSSPSVRSGRSSSR